MDPPQAAAFPPHFHPPPQPPPLSTDIHPTLATNHAQPLASHPSYTEMIMAAIMHDNSQGKVGGSSKRAIAKYIDRVYTELPPTHSALLTHHLMRLKASGQLVMVGKSYQLPGFRSVPSPHAHQTRAQAQTREVLSSGSGGVNGVSLGKRPRGRLPKAVAVAEVVVSERLRGDNVGDGGEEGVGDVGYEGEGEEGVGVGVGEVVAETVGKRVRGWPKGVPRGKKVRRRRAVATVVKRLHTGRPRGRPKKNPVLVKHTSWQGQELDNEDLLRKLEELRSKIRDAVGIIRPYLADQSAFDALTALQQLEEFSTVKETESPAVTEPPVTTMPVNLTAPPPASTTTAPESFNAAANSNLTAPSTMTSFTAPAMNAPLPFDVTVMPPFHAPSSINNRGPMNWMPSRAQS
ncbi:hypothetical protein RND81_03G200900 [Saponaria officinalis]|uniref:H15 domain-containing protein n=1 Tax=Saponaria officinalis TaxID=3572 RepID=A0AAW1MC04_SAPOF